MKDRRDAGPLFCHLEFVPTQAWALKWIRRRMSELGKDPRWYSIRSIRQGGSSSACELEMPELFLRASGGWKGNALERYRKDRLPTEQERFATLLSRLTTRTDGDASDTPGNLCGPFGSGGGSTGTNNSPPPSDLASSLLERGGRRALLSSSRSLAATPSECGGSQTLFSSPVHDAPVRAKMLIENSETDRLEIDHLNNETFSASCFQGFPFPSLGIKMNYIL